MLGLQASNLEQQERLYKNQIRLGLREILQQELNFYNNGKLARQLLFIIC
jgi:hypothetical protein